MYDCVLALIVSHNPDLSNVLSHNMAVEFHEYMQVLCVEQMLDFVYVHACL